YDQVVVHVASAHGLAELLEGEVIDVVRSLYDASLAEIRLLGDQGLLEDPVVAHHQVLRVLTVAGEVPQPTDHLQGLLCLSPAASRPSETIDQVLLHLLRRLPRPL